MIFKLSNLNHFTATPPLFTASPIFQESIANNIVLQHNQTIIIHYSQDIFSLDTFSNALGILS